MLTAYRGRIRVTTDETEMKGDLACVSKCIYLELTKMGNSPVMAVCKIISWVLMGRKENPEFVKEFEYSPVMQELMKCLGEA